MANVLIVEDSQPAADAQAHSLWASGHTVEFAGNGKTALEQFQAQHFDVILLDYDLPDTTGLALYHRLREIDKEVSVVMITGRGDERLAARILKEGAKDYLTKSNGLLEILPEVVQRVVNDREIQKQLVEQEKALKRAHEELEQKVARRTAELKQANQRLEQEIDYRRRVEKVLLQTNRDMLVILDSVNDGFVSLDGAGRISYINRAAREWLAPECPDPINKTFHDAFPWADGTGLEEKAAQTATLGKGCTFDIEVDSDRLKGILECRIYPRSQGVTVQLQFAGQRKNQLVRLGNDR